SSADSSLFGLEDWRDLNKKKELKAIFTNKKYTRWNKMRGNKLYGGTADSLDRRFIALTMPRVLAREPWGEGGRKARGFAFNEDASDHTKYCWTNAAYALARNIGQAFKLSGWPVQFRGR